MEDGVFGAGGVLEDGENGGHGAAEVGDVKRHCHVDSFVGARVGGFQGGAVWGIVEFWGLFEALSSGGRTARADARDNMSSGEEKEDTEIMVEGVANGEVGRGICPHINGLSVVVEKRGFDMT